MPDPLKKKTIGEPLPRPGRIKLGDVLAIPLGEQYWGYMRAFNDASYGVFSEISKNEILGLEEIKNSSPIFHVNCCESWDTPTWVYIGNWPFNDISVSWPPPTYHKDVLDSDLFKIYRQGQLTISTTKEDVEGMIENTGSLHPGSLVEKIRKSQEMSADRSEIERFAPYSSVWEYAP